MKKFLLIPLLLLMFVPSYVNAQYISYVRIESEEVGFYKTPASLDSELLFMLEKSYYLKIIDSSTVFYQVEIFDNSNGFNKLIGYVKKSEVVDQSTIPLNPLYPKISVTPNSNSVDLKSAFNNGSDTLAYCLKGQQLYYYGKVNIDNNIWYYVRMGNEFGYVNANFISAPNIALHPTPLPVKPPTVPPVVDPPSKPITGSDDGVIQLVLILLICIPAVIIVVLLFMPTKNNKKSTPIYATSTPTYAKPRYFDDKDEYNDSDLL